MAEIFLTNTLSRKKEKFVPINDSKVTIYSCGPTVYRNIHIGNLRTYISIDLLIRLFEHNGNAVRHVKNITDVGHMRTTGADEHYDPIINEALKQGKTPLEIAEKYTEVYFEDQKKLNIIDANENPKASEHIQEMIEIIKVLLEKGFAYEPEGNVLGAEGSAKPEGAKGSGTIYFDVKKFSDYGKLSGNTLEKMDQLLEAVRVSAETDKNDSADFALWKKGESDRAMIWDSPWGKGFPGWHIECSAMSLKHLTNSFESGKFDPEKVETIDIHTGGEDLVFPHHEDEIAQSEAASGKKFVNFWFHGGHLTVDGKKMSRSANNFYILADIEKRGFHPLSFRYLILTAHYRSRLNFTWESLEAAQNALNNLYREVSSLGKPTTVNNEYEEKFHQAINDDLDTPTALAVVWELVKSNLSDGEKAATLFEFDRFLGLDLDIWIQAGRIEHAEIWELVDQRQKAREEKDFAKSDEIRKQIAEKGFEVVDTESGPKLKKIIQ